MNVTSSGRESGQEEVERSTLTEEVAQVLIF